MQTSMVGLSRLPRPKKSKAERKQERKKAKIHLREQSRRAHGLREFNQSLEGLYVDGDDESCSPSDPRTDSSRLRKILFLGHLAWNALLDVSSSYFLYVENAFKLDASGFNLCFYSFILCFVYFTLTLHQEVLSTFNF
jgi:hypothetical protein